MEKEVAERKRSREQRQHVRRDVRDGQLVDLLRELEEQEAQPRVLEGLPHSLRRLRRERLEAAFRIQKTYSAFGGSELSKFSIWIPLGYTRI